MGRPRGFDAGQVLASAAALFVARGYEATSIDDLVRATGVHRGSLYQAFGSKRGLFVATLRRLVEDGLPQAPTDPELLVAGATLDLLLIAALELAPRDKDVRDLVDVGCALLADRLPTQDPYGPAHLLGRRLLERTRPHRPEPAGRRI